jgi:hypothetical protein
LQSQALDTNDPVKELFLAERAALVRRIEETGYQNQPLGESQMDEYQMDGSQMDGSQLWSDNEDLELVHD